MILKGILEFLRILVEFKFKNSKIPYRDPPVKLGDDIVGNFEFLEIAPSALLPRNDGIFEFSVMSSPPPPQSSWGMTERVIPKRGILKLLGILVEFKLKNSKIPSNSR